MDIKTLVGQRCLLKVEGEGYKNFGVDEYKIIQVAPSGNWIKLTKYGHQFWKPIASVSLVEVLTPLEQMPDYQIDSAWWASICNKRNWSLTENELRKLVHDYGQEEVKGQHKWVDGPDGEKYHCEKCGISKANDYTYHDCVGWLRKRLEAIDKIVPRQTGS